MIHWSVHVDEHVHNNSYSEKQKLNGQSNYFSYSWVIMDDRYLDILELNMIWKKVKLIYFWCMTCIKIHWAVLCSCPWISIDPLGRPGRDHCFCTCRPSVPTFQKLAKRGSGRVDHWWHLSCKNYFWLIFWKLQEL